MYYDEKTEPELNRYYYLAKNLKPKYDEIQYIVDEIHRIVLENYVQKHTTNSFSAKKFKNSEEAFEYIKSINLIPENYEIITKEWYRVKPKGRFGIEYKYKYKEQ